MNKLFTIWHNALQYNETEIKEYCLQKKVDIYA